MTQHLGTMRSAMSDLKERVAHLELVASAKPVVQAVTPLPLPKPAEPCASVLQLMKTVAQMEKQMSMCPTTAAVVAMLDQYAAAAEKKRSSQPPPLPAVACLSPRSEKENKEFKAKTEECMCKIQDCVSKMQVNERNTVTKLTHFETQIKEISEKVDKSLTAKAVAAPSSPKPIVTPPESTAAVSTPAPVATKAASKK